MLHLHQFHRPQFAPRQLLFAISFALTGGLAWWHLHTLPLEITQPLRPRLPDHQVWQLTAVETDASGQPTRQLTAPEVRHFVAENVSELDQPRVALLHNGGGNWTAQAEHGLVLQGGDQLRLLGAVEVTRAGDAQNRPLQLVTERLDIWREQALATTDVPVRIVSGGDTLTAPALQLWYARPARLNCHGRTQIQLAPAAAPLPSQ
jgi:lipopolysaccharide export system protein LptC